MNGRGGLEKIGRGWVKEAQGGRVNGEKGSERKERVCPWRRSWVVGVPDPGQVSDLNICRRGQSMF